MCSSSCAASSLRERILVFLTLCLYSLKHVEIEIATVVELFVFFFPLKCFCFIFVTRS